MGASGQFRRNTLASIPTLASGEPFFATDKKGLWIGDGTDNHWIGGVSVSAMAYASDTGDTTLTAAAYTVVLFDAEVWDDFGYHSTASNTGRMTCPAGYAGKHDFVGSVEIAGQTSTSTAFVRLTRYNSGGSFQEGRITWPVDITAARDFGIQVAGSFILAVADYVTLEVLHNSTGTVVAVGDDVTGGKDRTWLVCHYRGK